MSAFELKRIMEGKCGNDFTPAWEVYVDGEIVGYAKQKWLAKAIGEAIVAGHIEKTGDTTGRFMIWASVNDREAFDRMPENI